MKLILIIVIIFIAGFIFSLGALAVLILAYAIQKKDIESNLNRKISFKEFLKEDFYIVNQNKENSTSSDEDYSPTEFDKEIFSAWAATPTKKGGDKTCVTLTRKELFDFAEYYHKAKS